MRVLVTGAAGFLGYAVAALLVEHEHEVIGLTRSEASVLSRVSSACKATCAHPGPAQSTGRDRGSVPFGRADPGASVTDRSTRLLTYQPRRHPGHPRWTRQHPGRAAGPRLHLHGIQLPGQPTAQRERGRGTEQPLRQQQARRRPRSRGPRHHRRDWSHQPLCLQRGWRPARPPRPRHHPAHPLTLRRPTRPIT